MNKVTNDLLQKNYTLLKNKELPKTFGNKFISPFIINKDFIPWKTLYNKDIGFPLYAEDWIKPLAEWIGSKKCLEVMAGTGYLSHFLSNFNVEIKATDNYSTKNFAKNQVFPVEQLNFKDSIKKYGKDTDIIICTWPNMMKDEVLEMLDLMRQKNPNCQMIFMGNRFSFRDFTGKEFFNKAKIQKDEKFDQAVSNYTSWAGLNDWILLIK